MMVTTVQTGFKFDHSQKRKEIDDKVGFD